MREERRERKRQSGVKREDRGERGRERERERVECVEVGHAAP